MGTERAKNEAGGRRFVWPPGRAVEVAAQEPAAVAVAAPAAPGVVSSRGGLRAAMLEVERVWLGLVRPPLRDRIEAAGWAPDGAGRYCFRCGSTAGVLEVDEGGCPACRGGKLPWERMVRLGEYSGLLREVVQEVKFGRWRRLGDELGAILGESLEAELAAAGVEAGQAVLVPVPPSFRRRMARGVDHTMVLARGVSRRTGIPIAACLTRRHRPSQLSVPASRRKSNAAGSFGFREGVLPPDRLVVVLDDVTTTRATMLAACRAVRAGCKVIMDKGLEAETGVWAAVAAVTPMGRGGPAGRRPVGSGGSRSAEAAGSALGSAGVRSG